MSKSESAGWRTGAGSAFLRGNSNGDYSTFAAVDKFRVVMLDTGIACRDRLVADGKLHRFYVEGDRRGSRNGWYCLHLDGIPAGAFGSWKLGLSQAWCAKDKAALSHAERLEYRARLDDIKRQREAELTDRHTKARERALAIWRLAQPVESHPYLSQKRVRAYGIRQYKGCLVIPLRDTQGTIHSLQFIDVEGRKRFLKGGAITDHYHAIGRYQGVLCVCEGYATGATIHQATGHAVAVAFNAGNLKSVAIALRTKFPNARIIVCADNDPVGIAKGREAAQAVQGCITLPDFEEAGHGG
jgi:putative DNA primase/helicase